jgi:hypothetical protein
MDKWNVQEQQAYAGDVGPLNKPYRWRRPDAKNAEMVTMRGSRHLFGVTYFNLILADSSQSSKITLCIIGFVISYFSVLAHAVP